MLAQEVRGARNGGVGRQDPTRPREAAGRAGKRRNPLREKKNTLVSLSRRRYVFAGWRGGIVFLLNPTLRSRLLLSASLLTSRSLNRPLCCTSVLETTRGGSTRRSRTQRSKIARLSFANERTRSTSTLCVASVIVDMSTRACTRRGRRTSTRSYQSIVPSPRWTRRRR